MSSCKYLFSQGELSRKDQSLCFRRNEKNVYIPIENTKELYCMNELSLNSKLLDFLASNHTIVHFFNYYGQYSGSYFPREHHLSGKLLIQQVNAFQERRMEPARAIVLGIAKNLYEVLYHYYKHGKKEVKDCIDWLHKIDAACEAAQTPPELMAIEGEAWQRFYACFACILPDGYALTKRVRQPPDNPINALVSFGNSLLYTKTISAIFQTHLDQRISFLHQPSDRRFSLSLDMCEVFKPIIVFKCIFELVNNRVIQLGKHFEKKVNYCMLNEVGRKTFVESFEKRLESVFYHERLKRKVSYRTAIKLDCYKLIKFILENKPFEPFNISKGM